jgi:tRNA G46 methylase TrmB
MNVDIDVKDFNCSKLEKDKKLHYELTKKYFRKSATFKEGYYTTKNTEELKQEIRKRDMWDIYSSNLDEILQNNYESKSVIDVGCGMGNFTLELVNREQFKKIVGIDFLKETLYKITLKVKV